MDNLIKDSLVAFRTNQGIELRASVLRLGRYQAVFEVYNPAGVLHLSEVLSDFRIVINERTVYCGKAVVAGLVNTGTMLICEAKLDEAAFSIGSPSPAQAERGLRGGFDDFIGQWQELYRVLPEFKVVIADMQTFLMDLRLWLEQVEL